MNSVSLDILIRMNYRCPRPTRPKDNAKELNKNLTIAKGKSKSDSNWQLQTQLLLPIEIPEANDRTKAEINFLGLSNNNPIDDNNIRTLTIKEYPVLIQAPISLTNIGAIVDGADCK